MNALVIVGIVVLLCGILVLVNNGFTYTTREKVLDIGPIEAHKETQKTIPLPPVLGGVGVVGGIALVIAGARK